MRGVWITPKNISEYEEITIGAMSPWVMEFNKDKKIFIIDLELVDEENCDQLSDLVEENYDQVSQETFVGLEEFDYIVLEVE